MLRTRWPAAFIFGLFFVLSASAEPGTPPGDEITAIKLDYAKQPGKPGRLATAEVTISETPVRYYVRGTDISAPLSVQVVAGSAARPVEVTLHRQNWGKPVQSGSTGASGSYAFEGRAYGDVGVQLASPDGLPARATVLFWQGAPATQNMATVYTNPVLQAESAATGGVAGPRAGPGWIMYVIAICLALIVILLGITVLRRGGRGTAAAFLLLCLAAGLAAPGQVFAQDPEKPPGAPSLEEPKPEETPNPFDVDKPPPEIPRDKDKDATAGKPEDKPKDPSPGNPFVGETTLGSGRPIELKPEDFDPGNAPKDDPAPEDAPVDDGYADRLAQAEQRISDLDRQASANRAEIERLRLLVESDRDMEPDPSNLPPMPLSCRPPAVERGDDPALEAAWENYDACETCFRQPLSELDEVILNYERLRILYMSTADFVSTAITMGDTVPKPHQFVEMSWAQQKADIQKSFQGTKDAYDAKWTEFNGRLRSLLDEVGKCEADLNNNPLWRTTDGEMFYQGIKSSYQRTN